MISYAQNFEDVMLHRCFAGRKDGFYIDVGAMDPVVDSVTKFFYDEGWSGINIEPNDWFYSKLMRERPRDINLNLAVGESEGRRLFHLFEQYGISTFDESHRDRFIEQGFEAKEKMVRITTLASVCREYVTREIDFLKIDCEGWEKFALQGADWDRFRPIIVIVEATEPLSASPSWAEWEPVLTENRRYEMVYFDGLNRFYLRREYADLRTCFAAPPNVFDEFTTYPLEHARESSAALTQERDALVRERSAQAQERSALAQERDALGDQLAGLEQRLSTMSAENARLIEMEEKLIAKTDECLRLSGSLDISIARARELETQIAHHQNESCKVDEQLRKTRLWVGQLSQDLAAARNR